MISRARAKVIIIHCKFSMLQPSSFLAPFIPEKHEKHCFIKLEKQKNMKLTQGAGHNL